MNNYFVRITYGYNFNIYNIKFFFFRLKMCPLLSKAIAFKREYYNNRKKLRKT